MVGTYNPSEKQAAFCLDTTCRAKSLTVVTRGENLNPIMFSVTMKEITFGEKQLIQDQNPFIVSNYRQAKNTGYPKGFFSLIFFFFL